MKKILLSSTIAFIATIAPLLSNAQWWQWAKSGGGMWNDIGQSIATDPSGNVVVTGWFWSDSITFDSFSLNNAQGGTNDIFIVKFNVAGNILWAKRIGGTSHDDGLCITTDANGNVLVTGSFQSSFIIFGSDTLNNPQGPFRSEIFVVKYDSTGSVLWAKSAGGANDDYGQSISSDANGNVLVTGRFESPKIIFGTDTLNNAGWDDIFVAKYDANGNVIWARSAGGTVLDVGNSIISDSMGNIYITGYFQDSSIIFGSDTLNNTGGSWYDLFIVKYDVLGNVIWAKGAGGGYHDIGQSIVVDASGNVCITGSFESTTIIFGTDTLNNANMFGASPDIFVAKYDSSGNILWAKRAGGVNIDEGESVTIDNSGNILVAGSFQSPTVTFDAVTLNNTSSGYPDIFVVKFDTAGTSLWAESAVGVNGDVSYGVATDATGNIFVTGIFSVPSIAFDSYVLNNLGGVDIFVAKLSATTGINEDIIIFNKITIFPNPFSAQTTLQTDNPFHNATLTVYNCFGQTVKQVKNISGQTVVFSRDNLVSGLYFVRLTEDKKIFTDKLIITDR